MYLGELKTMVPIYGKNIVCLDIWTATHYADGSMIFIDAEPERKMHWSFEHISQLFEAVTPRDSVHLSHYKYQALNSINSLKVFAYIYQYSH